MPIRELPEAPASLHILGPGMLLAALGVGLGETYLWPRLVILFGPDIRWLFFIGVTLQAVVMLEMARWATATGESIFFGASRLWRPDRKSTRLNSSHSQISYAVFCLKKKKKHNKQE